ncbi:hypothetical protein AB0L41_07685 [Amycolatopsis mediterranei]|uniref:hypothetical protein n=1 Tax=Amycolatopsis mediterranei TaxID=33910 RepID=UPI00344124D6
MATAIFEVAGQIRQAMTRPEFRHYRQIGLDAYPYRALNRGKVYLAFFVVSSPELIEIVAIGRVAPGDRSGMSNRNLEFDLCREVAPAVIVQSDTAVYYDLVRALKGRTALNDLEEQNLLDVISESSKSAASDVEDLLTQVESNVLGGSVGFLLSCEQDAVVLSLKAANLQRESPKLSLWQANSLHSPFMTGLSESRDPQTFQSCVDHGVLESHRSEVLSSFGWMRVARSKDGQGTGVTLVNVRPVGTLEPAGVDFVYFDPGCGNIALLHYGKDWTLDGYLDYVDDLYEGQDDPHDPRLSSNPVFAKRVIVENFAAGKNLLIGGQIRIARDIRVREPGLNGRFSSERHLSNSTFASLLGGGWLGGRAADFGQVRDVVELVLDANRAVVVAVRSTWDPPPANQRLF